MPNMVRVINNGNLFKKFAYTLNPIFQTSHLVSSPRQSFMIDLLNIQHYIYKSTSKYQQIASQDHSDTNKICRILTVFHLEDKIYVQTLLSARKPLHCQFLSRPSRHTEEYAPCAICYSRVARTQALKDNHALGCALWHDRHSVNKTI